MKTTSLGRNVSSRESEVTGYKPTGFGRKSKQSLWPRTEPAPGKLPFHPHPATTLSRLLAGWYVRNHDGILRMCIQGHRPNPFTCFHHIHEQKNLEMPKSPPAPVHCHRRESGTMSSYVKIKLWAFSFLSTRALPSTDVQRFPRQWEQGLLSCAPIVLCTLLPALDQSLFPSLTDVSRNPSANR